MSEIVQGLFGLSPNQVQQQQQAGIDARADAYARQDPFERATAGMYRAGAGIAGIGAGMMGMVNPQIEEAKRRESVMGTGGDLSTSAGLKAKAQEFAQAGDQQTAMQLMMVARQKEAEEQKLTTEQRKAALGERKQDFQEEEMLAFRKAQMQQGFDIKREQLERDKAKDIRDSEDRRLSTEQRDAASRRADATDRMIAQLVNQARMAGIDAKKGGGGDSKQPLAYIDPSTGQAVYGTITEARGKKPASMDAFTASGVASGKAIGQGQGKDIALIPKMQEGLDSVNEALATVNKGIYTGAYANIIKGAVKFTPGMDKTKAANTEAYIAQIGNVVVPRLQEFGGSDSNEELKYLQKISAGDVTVEKGALVTVLNSAKVKMEKEIARRQAGHPASYAKGSGPKIETNERTVAPGVKRYNPLTGKIE